MPQDGIQDRVRRPSHWVPLSRTQGAEPSGWVSAFLFRRETGETYSLVGRAKAVSGRSRTTDPAKRVRNAFGIPSRAAFRRQGKGIAKVMPGSEARVSAVTIARPAFPAARVFL